MTDPYHRHVRVRAQPGPMTGKIRIRVLNNRTYRPWRWECETCIVYAKGKWWRVGGTCNTAVRWTQARIIHTDGMEYQRGYYKLIESGFTRAVRGAERHVRKYHTYPYGEKK